MRSGRSLTASFRLHALAMHMAYECGLDDQVGTDSGLQLDAELSKCVPPLSFVAVRLLTCFHPLVQDGRRLLHTMSFYQACFILEYGKKCGALLLTRSIECPVPEFDDAASRGFSPCKAIQHTLCVIGILKSLLWPFVICSGCPDATRPPSGPG
jgi:hypothetical protein